MTPQIATDSFWFECAAVAPDGAMTLRLMRGGPTSAESELLVVPATSADHGFWCRLVGDRRVFPGMFSHATLVQLRDEYRPVV